LFQNFADVECSITGHAWIGMSNENRIVQVSECIQKQDRFSGFEVIRTHENGNIIVNFPPDLGANKRGTLLLDLEEYLKNEIDGGVVVWCDPLGDKSTLRNLRGIQIRS
jgi:hypothetical protein